MQGSIQTMLFPIVLMAGLATWLAPDVWAQTETEPQVAPVSAETEKAVDRVIEEDVLEEDEFEARESRLNSGNSEPEEPKPVQPEPAKSEPSEAEPSNPEPSPTPEPAKPTSPSPAPAKPEPASPEPQKPEPSQPPPAKASPPKSAAPQPAPTDLPAAPGPDNAQPAPTPSRDAALQELETRIIGLETQVKQLLDRPAIPLDVEKTLQQLVETNRALGRRLDAIEKRLEQQASAGRDAVPTGSSDARASASESQPEDDATSGSARLGRISSTPSAAASPAEGGQIGAVRGKVAGETYYYKRTPSGWIVRVPAPQRFRRRPPEPAEPPRPDVSQPETGSKTDKSEAASTEGAAIELPADASETRKIAVSGEPVRVEGLGPEDAGSLYTTGYNLYWRGRHAQALKHFQAAIALRQDDARFLYYQGLCQLALGQEAAAKTSFQQAAQLEHSGQRQTRQVSLALERLQGPPRMRVEEYRSAARAQAPAY